MKICIIWSFDFWHHFYILLLTDSSSFPPNTKSTDDFVTLFCKSLLSVPYEFGGSKVSCLVALAQKLQSVILKKIIVRLLINFGLEPTQVRHLRSYTCIHTEIV